MSGVQYRLVLGKKDEQVAGPDAAAVVVPLASAAAALAPAVAFMLGKLKATGPTGPLFDALSSGDAARRIAELVAND
ncbi:MAG: hypothetical protein ACO3TV_07775 [Ilumatobacteraceae bacterium]